MHSGCLPSNHTVWLYLIGRNILCLIGIISNISLLTGLLKDPLKCFRNSPSYLVANLAISDLLACTTTLARDYMAFCLQKHGVFLTVRVIHIAFVYMSYLSIISIALDRYLSVIHPLKYKILVNGKRTFFVILFKWLMVITCTALFKLVHGIKWKREIQSIGGIIIISLATFLYIRTTYKIKKASRYLESLDIQSTTSNVIKKKRLLNEKRFLKTICLVSVLALTTQLPYHIFHYIASTTGYASHSTGKVNTKYHVHGFLFVLLTSNFCINPFIYWCRLTKYRKTFLRLFWRHPNSQ